MTGELAIKRAAAARTEAVTMTDKLPPKELAAIKSQHQTACDLFGDGETSESHVREFHLAHADRNSLLRHVEALEQENDRLRQERYDALSVYTKEGLLASEWVARTGKAERERNEAQEKTKALEQEINSRCEHCGAKVYSGPPDCPMCGAPNCCQQCCQIDHLKQEVERLSNPEDDIEILPSARESYKVKARISRVINRTPPQKGVEMNQRMTDERLAELIRIVFPKSVNIAYDLVSELLQALKAERQEVERLREETSILRAELEEERGDGV